MSPGAVRREWPVSSTCVWTPRRDGAPGSLVSIVDALLSDSSRPTVTLRRRRPAPGLLGSAVQAESHDRWLASPGRLRSAGRNQRDLPSPELRKIAKPMAASTYFQVLTPPIVGTMRTRASAAAAEAPRRRLRTLPNHFDAGQVSRNGGDSSDVSIRVSTLRPAWVWRRNSTTADASITIVGGRVRGIACRAHVKPSLTSPPVASRRARRTG